MIDTREKAAQLILDMVKNGATEDEMNQAVYHSMTIILCEKEIRQSAEQNGIDELQKKYGRKNEE